jgi:DNA-directed RNA polymerase specialized sigma24 family protein
MEDPCWPSFLDLIDSDPDTARAQIGYFILKRLKDTPPSIIRAFDEKDYPGLYNEVFLHCVNNDFKIIRKYINNGKPFAGWLHCVAYNKLYDIAKQEGLIKEKKFVFLDETGNPGHNVRTTPDDPSKVAELNELISIVRNAISQLGRDCRLLLEMASDEFNIGEMLTILRQPQSKNKWLSDKLRYCRNKLRKLLENMKIDWSLA